MSAVGLASFVFMQVVIQVAEPPTETPDEPTPIARVAPLPTPAAPRPDVIVTADAGYARGSLFGRAMTGPCGTAGIGLAVPRSWGAIEVSGDAEYDALQSSHGIGVHRFAAGVTLGVRIWHVHLESGPDLGSTWIVRVSGSDLSAHELFVGIHTAVRFDLFSIGQLTPYVQGRVDLNTVMPTVTANGGLRIAF